MHAAMASGSVGFSAPGIGGIPGPPTLRVLLIPGAARVAGGQWNVDGGTWRNSGETAVMHAEGQHTVSSLDIVGWTAPASEIVTLSNNTATALANRTYVEYGSISIVLTPVAAVADGATWAIDGGTSISSGSTSSVPPGLHSITYGGAAAWIAPTTEVVVVVSGTLQQYARGYAVNTDTDSDGLADSWEQVWFGSLIQEPGDDPDLSLPLYY